MKLDIQSFFMSLPKERLYRCVEVFINKNYPENDKALLLSLLKTCIYHRPEKNYIRRCPASRWQYVPEGKSLFHTDGKHGEPTGNQLVQLLANLYLDELDHLITEEWGVACYGRYVDDMGLVHPEKAHLLAVRKKIRGWLAEQGLTLHPCKMYLQHYSKGIAFIGGVVKPGRKYIGNRTVKYLKETLWKYNRLAERQKGYAEMHGEEFVSSVNSYLGQMRHFASYNIRKEILLGGGISPEWWKVIYVSGHLEKIVLKKQYKTTSRIQREMRREKVTFHLIKKETA